MLRLDNDAATNRYFVAASNPPFLGWREVTATSLAAIKPGNFVRYRNLTGTSRSVTLQSVDNDAVGIHGIQIINSGTDTDGDGMSDALEIEHRFNPAVPDATADADSDGMNNAAEIAAGTDPRHRDTDRDGIADGAEAAQGTSPLNPDSDGDTLTDGEELNSAYFTSFPTDADSDDDGFSDAAERTYGSDPKSAASTPPPVPVWNAGTRTWLWRIDNVRALWNHEQSMLGAIEGDDTMLFEAVADINQSGWTRQIGMGVRYINGKLVHRFRAIEGAFYRSGNTTAGFWDSDWNASPVDRTRAFGFSGYGAADDSLPLRLEFSATQPNSGTNLWTLNFRIFDLTNPAAPVTLASYTDNTAVAADASLLSGTTVWKNQSGTTGRVDYPEGNRGPRGDHAKPARPRGQRQRRHAGHLGNHLSVQSRQPCRCGAGLRRSTAFPISGNFSQAPIRAMRTATMTALRTESNSTAASTRSPPRAFPTWFNFTGKIDDLDDDGLSDSWVLWSGGKTPPADRRRRWRRHEQPRRKQGRHRSRRRRVPTRSEGLAHRQRLRALVDRPSRQGLADRNQRRPRRLANRHRPPRIGHRRRTQAAHDSSGILHRPTTLVSIGPASVRSIPTTTALRTGPRRTCSAPHRSARSSLGQSAP